MSNDLSFTSADAILAARADRHTQTVALADRIIFPIYPALTQDDNLYLNSGFGRSFISSGQLYINPSDRKHLPLPRGNPSTIPEYLAWPKERVEALAGRINRALVDPSNDPLVNFEVIIHLSSSEYTYLQPPECPITAALKLAGFTTRFENCNGGKSSIMLVNIAERRE